MQKEWHTVLGDVQVAVVDLCGPRHVIELLDTREETPPTFDAVKQRVQQLVQQKKIRGYQDDLMKTATIKKKL